MQVHTRDRPSVLGNVRLYLRIAVPSPFAPSSILACFVFFPFFLVQFNFLFELQFFELLLQRLALLEQL